jgi:hypothetical protein
VDHIAKNMAQKARANLSFNDVSSPDRLPLVSRNKYTFARNCQATKETWVIGYTRAAPQALPLHP